MFAESLSSFGRDLTELGYKSHQKNETTRSLVNKKT